MALDIDNILDRRRLKRRLTFWRVIAVVAVVAVVIVGIGQFRDIGERDHVAVLNVSNVIVANPIRDTALKRLIDDDRAKAVLVRINSPGGTVVGGEQLFLNLRKVAEKKPIVAVINELGTSAGYMAAIGADYIIARQGSITGSIGVLLQTTNITGLLEKLGISAEAIKSAPLKATPNPLEPLTPAARAATQAIVSDMYDMFVNMVSDRRKMDLGQVRQLADGRVFTGRQALKNGLIDELGGDEEARAWLASEKGVDKDLSVRVIETRRRRGAVRELLDSTIGKTLFSERLTLDGVISLWQPDFN